MKMQPLALALSLGLTAITAQAAVDAGIPAYAKTSGISGNLSSVGSDTLANLMTFWAEDFKKDIRMLTCKFKQQVRQLLLLP